MPSFARFSVDCSSSKSGSGFNESGDRIWRCKVIVLNESSKMLIDTAEKTVKAGKIISPVQVNAGNVGVIRVIVEVEDTLGAINRSEGLAQVVKGTTGRDVPIVYISDTITCYQGEECVFDAQETKDRDDAVSKFEFRIMDGNKEGEQMNNSFGPCSAPVCK